MLDLFVAFDDSFSTPTYNVLSDAYLVEAPDDGPNPCISEDAKWVPVIPKNPQDLRDWAAILGWTVEEQDGKLVVVTDIR